MKTIAQIEAWALAIVEMVVNDRKVEDSRVELKREWPDPARAARRIAGHANAAGGEEVLWIIGLDETDGLVSIQPIDLARWIPQLAAEFDGLAPTIRDVVVPVGQSMVVALAVDTTRAPYVVKNPAFGSAGTSVQLEVPWRDGTSTRSARRQDLIRILATTDAPPEVEVVGGRIVSQVAKALPQSPHVSLAAVYYGDHITWTVGIEVYVLPTNRDRLVFPLHKCRLSWQDSDGLAHDATSIGFVQFDLFARETKHPSQTVISTPTEAVIEGPGKLALTGKFIQPLSERAKGPIKVMLELRPGLAARPILVTAAYVLTHDNENGMFWALPN